LAFAGSQV